jgi:hypothetical protein
MKDASLAHAPVDAARSAAARASRPASLGPGWFESSWDLRSGLDVREEGRADAALRSWIDAFFVASAVQPRLALVASPSAMTAIA